MKITRFALRGLLALCPLLFVLQSAALAEVSVEIRLLLTPGDAVMRPSVEPLSPRAQHAVHTVPALDRSGHFDLTGASRRNGSPRIGIPMLSGPPTISGQSVEHVTRVSLRIDTNYAAIQGGAQTMPLEVVLDIPSHVGAELSIRCATPSAKVIDPLLKARAIPCISD
jgi:hypothetical protein